jgi:hypothetical protein
MEASVGPIDTIFCQASAPHSWMTREILQPQAGRLESQAPSHERRMPNSA